jgi:pyridoxal phosphate enzyme (YggS family)
MALRDVQKRIAEACRQVGRKSDDVTLIAVTKNRSLDDIRHLIAQGQKDFGENRIQDAMEKWPALKAEFPDINLHFIGHLQTNKAKEAVALFDTIHTVDSERLAMELAKEMQKKGRSLPCFIQVNTGEEAQKGGIVPRDLEKLFLYCRDEAKLNVQGLMCIPPESDIPDLHFALLHKLSRELGLSGLSMGMSADLERAIAFGATHIRVGTALYQV